MANIGEATIRIIGDSSAFDRTVNNLGKNASGFLGNADRIGTRFGESVGRATGKALRIGLLAAAGGVAAAVGVTLVKGFKRFTTIEDATASLTLLLGDAKAAADLLGKTLKVVEGTPFALEDFVDATRNLVANNVKLEKVPRILTAIGDAAAAAGGTAEDVNNVVNSFSRMATGAQLTLGPIRELEEKGVPALRILANQAGKSAEQMAKDITAGSVDSQKAIDDLTTGILEGTEGINGATVAYGGAAKNVGNTVSGAFANMRTAVARAGANIIKVFADSGKGGDGLVKILNSMRKSIDVLGKAGVRLAEDFVEGGTMQSILDFFERLPNRIDAAARHIGTEGGFRRAILTLFRARDFDELTENVLDGIQRAFTRIPADQLSGVIVTVITRGFEGLARSASAITAVVLKNAPAIIKGVIEGFLKAAAANPLNMALFLGALGLPGIGAAIIGFFRVLPFGFLVAPLLTGLQTAIRSALGKTPLIPNNAIAQPLANIGAQAGAAIVPVSGLASALRGIAALGIITVGVTLVLKPVVEKAAGIVGQALQRVLGGEEDFGRAFGAGLDPLLQKLEQMARNMAANKIIGVDMANAISEALHNMGDVSAEEAANIEKGFGVLVLAARRAGVDMDKVTAALASGLDADAVKVDLLAGKFDKLGEKKVKPEVEVTDNGSVARMHALLDTLTRQIVATLTVRGSLGGPLGGAGPQGHSGGLVMHSGGIVPPRLHKGTINRMASGFTSRLRNDERAAILQVGELVLSKKQVAAAKAGISQDGSRGHTFNIYEVGDAQATAERIINRLAVG